ncbi:hypothetical protein RchiOBHm_Chr2g0160411 [Rosa chinensis]|uniref:Uncharacterized protein n=1 Tax=Rosa chinensis TaxID=74649 RepID=A0A2P6S2J6_ROSCH|nr:hypothetical protein RchiOBHm_Chr2g0160411 [Rosa chinensis]
MVSWTLLKLVWVVEVTQLYLSSLQKVVNKDSKKPIDQNMWEVQSDLYSSTRLNIRRNFR